REAPLYRVLRRYDAHPLHAAQEYWVLGQQGVVLREALGHDLQEGVELLQEAGWDVLWKTAHPLGVEREARPGLHLQQVEDKLSLPHRIQKHRDGPEVHDVRAQPQQVGGDALQLRENHAQVLGALWYLDAHQILDRLDQGVV